MRKKEYSRVEREWVEEHLGKLSVREMADRLGRSKSDVGRATIQIRRDMHLPLPPDPRYPDADEPDPPDGTEERLVELASRLRCALLTADERNLGAIARQYRETVLALGEVRDSRRAAEDQGAPRRDHGGGATVLRMAIEDRGRKASTG